MMPNVYAQHHKAFAHMSAYVVTRDGDRVATVAFKHSRNGTDKLFCYLHVIGAPMVRTYVLGGDKHTTAVHTAIARVRPDADATRARQIAGDFRAAVTDNGASWDQDLRRAGFSVWQAI